MRARRPGPSGGSRGQAMVELALVFPLFLLVFFGVITLGIGVFYQQQVTNAAREAARFASIHSATAQCPTVSWLDPNSEDPAGSGNYGVHAAYQPDSYVRCDRPEDSWPAMTADARSLIFGLDATQVNIAACWSGYRINDGSGNPTGPFDAQPPNTYDVIGTVDSGWAQCTIDGADPTVAPNAIGCTTSLATTTQDEASDLSEGPGRIVANTVTAYACLDWSPPLAGFLLIPDTVTLRAVITEPIQRQQ